MIFSKNSLIWVAFICCTLCFASEQNIDGYCRPKMNNARRYLPLFHDLTSYILLFTNYKMRCCAMKNEQCKQQDVKSCNIMTILRQNKVTSLLLRLRPFLFYRFFSQQVSVGGRNENKNKIHSDHFPIELKSKETQLFHFNSIGKWYE